MNKLGQANEGPAFGRYSHFAEARLTDGTTLHDIWLTRATGYDTSIWITDGTTIAPMQQVLFLSGPK